MNTTNNPAAKMVKVQCPKCEHNFKIRFGVLMGRVSSEAKAASAAANGKLGGRPKHKPAKGK